MNSELDTTKTNDGYTCEGYAILSLEQILNLDNPKIKLEMLKQYIENVKQSMTNHITKNIVTKKLLVDNSNLLNARVNSCIDELNGLLNNELSHKLRYDITLIDIYNEICDFQYKNTSNFISPGDIILFYPNIREVKAINNITSDIQGSIIKTGSYYIEYKPFLDNITKNICYVLKKSIRAEMGYRQCLPIDLHEFENWMIYINNSYSINKEDAEFDFYDLYTNYQGSLKLKTLKKAHKKEKIV